MNLEREFKLPYMLWRFINSFHIFIVRFSMNLNIGKGSGMMDIFGIWYYNKWVTVSKFRDNQSI